jgi:hypothetical protein
MDAKNKNHSPGIEKEAWKAGLPLVQAMPILFARTGIDNVKSVNSHNEISHRF